MSLCNHLIFALIKPNQVALVSAAALHLSQPGVEPAAGAGGSRDSGMAAGPPGGPGGTRRKETNGRLLPPLL